MEESLRVFAIDDDPIVLRSLERVLRSNGFPVEVFSSAAAFLERSPYDGVACVLLDLRMPGLDGLHAQEAMTSRGILHPIIFVSGQGDVPSAAQAMREGAVDFLIKPIDESGLLAAIRRAEARATASWRKRQSEHDAQERFARLTKREREVCNLVARGLLNKQIAYELGTGEKVVKVHRGRAMRKLEVDSVAALVRLFAALPRGAFPQD